jgi:hypothetical protein
MQESWKPTTGELIQILETYLKKIQIEIPITLDNGIGETHESCGETYTPGRLVIKQYINGSATLKGIFKVDEPYQRGKMYIPKGIFYIGENICQIKITGYVFGKPRIAGQNGMEILPRMFKLNDNGDYIGVEYFENKDDMIEKLHRLLRIKPNITKMFDQIITILEKIELNTRPKI